MALIKINGYRAYNDSGEIIPVLVPVWDSTGTITGLNGDKTIAEIITDFPDFPIEATWFTHTTQQKQNLINAGVPNVWSITEIVDSGDIHWYFDEDKTHYLEFSYNGSNAYITVYAPDVTETVITYLTANNLSKNQYRRCRTIFSDTNVEDRAPFVYWNTPNNDGTLYMYYNTTAMPTRLAVTDMEAVDAFWNGLEPVTIPSDPYEQGGISGPGGGTGTFSDTGDIIGVPSLPTLSAVDTGFISLFNPTALQIKELANYMWSSNFDMSAFKNIVANPIQCILGLTIVPVDPPNAGVKTLTVGNIATDVSMPYLSSQYVEVDCGTLNIVEFWGSYLDYSPYTKLSLYLPYIGIVPIDIDDAQNSTIKVVYHVDVLSGACVAYVLCGGTQLYTYIGQCSSNIPITSNDFTNTVNGILGIAGNIGTLVSDVASAASSPMGGVAIAGSAISAAANIASNAIEAFKPNIQKSGSISGTGGMMGVQTPYLICQRPRQSVPAYQNTFMGYPSNINAVLGDLSGYTEISSIHLNNIPATDEELIEIESLLKGGVLI